MPRKNTEETDDIDGECWTVACSRPATTRVRRGDETRDLCAEHSALHVERGEWELVEWD